MELCCVNNSNVSLLYCVTFDTAMVTSMTGWFETEFEIEINFISHFKQLSHSNLRVFYCCIGLERTL